jgi:hypothetical protein
LVPHKEFKRGRDIPPLKGGWVAVGELGRGGNGTVFRATKDGQEGAFKLLNAARAMTLKHRMRFVREIEAMRRCAHLPGVLPLLDAVPIVDGRPLEQPWLVSVIAKPMEKALAKGALISDIVVAIHEIASALADMHALGISHRDIKPDNLFLHDGRWCVGDLGLAAYEDQEALTAVGERLGPTFYIATEMLNGSHTADGRKADVFSLAKTLWKLITGLNFPIPGAYARGQPVYSLATYVLAPRARLLDPLICMATDHDPSKRPTMQEFSDGLNQWLTPAAPAKSSGPIYLDVERFRDRIDSLEAEGVARASEAALREAERKSINARWVGPLTSLSDRIYTSLQGLPFSKVVRHDADTLNCGGSIEAWVNLVPSGARATLRLIYNFQAFDHPRCQLMFTAAIQFQESRGAANSDVLQQETVHLVEGTADEQRVLTELNSLVDHGLQGWVNTLFERVDAYEIHRSTLPAHRY